MMVSVLGRLHPLNLDHVTAAPLAEHLRTLGVAPVPADAVKLYDISVIYNQGSTPQCPGFSAAAMTTAMQTPSWGPQMFDATAIYTYANTHDGMSEPHDGSTVHAAMECLTTVGASLANGWAPKPGEPGHLLDKSVMWATDLDTVCQYLYSQSAMVIGIDWSHDMFHVDSQGYVRATGGNAGGHAICVRGVNMHEEHLILRQSWGALWGGTVDNTTGAYSSAPGGDCKLAFTDFATVMGQYGEAAAVVVVPPSITSPSASSQASTVVQAT